MKQGIYKITLNRPIAKNTFKMVLEGETTALKKPGQFINIKLDGFYLRRPISVCDYSGSEITIIYKVVGSGTEKMSGLKAGDTLDLLVGLGNGFSPEKSGKNPLLVGGGVGIPPLYNLCKALVSKGKKPTVILGFNSSEEVFYEEEFKAAGAEVLTVTVDGSYGKKGFVTDYINQFSYDYFYACGPMPMFSAMEKIMKTSGEYSFEERMGCGFGACMGCSCKTKYGNKRICKDGPVLEREEIIW